MLDYAKALNKAQYDAVTCDDEAVLVVAGAGSGKTRTITYRLAWLLERGIGPESILLLTFTRKAAQEMLDRAAHLLGAPVTGLTGGTFHAFAYGVLRRFPPQWLQGRPSTLLDPADIGPIIRQCRDTLQLARGDSSFPKSQTIADIISKARNKELAIEEILQQESFHLLPHAADIERIASAYQAYKREKGLLDYDDLLFELEGVLKEDAGQAIGARFSHVLVDEYQDTNSIQARIVATLAALGAKVMAVGDEAQSIYAFRGANVRNMLDFQKTFPKTRLIPLEENYRSTQPILDVANSVLAHASESFGKKLYTKSKGGEAVRIIRPLSDMTQAEMISSRISELLEEYRAEDIAVLFRSGFHSYQLENALRRDGIGFRKYGGLRFVEASHIKDIFAFARLILNPHDLPAFGRIAAMHKGIGPKTAQKLHNLLAANDRGGLAKACKKFPGLLADLDFIDGLRLNLPQPREIMLEIIHHYHPALERLYPEDWPSRLPGLEEITQLAAGYESLDLFMADVALDAAAPAQDEDNLVTLSTIHSAKGLEWKVVLILDLVEDRFPSRHAIARQEDYEEERRLFYVACTRARERLELFAPAAIFNKNLQARVAANQSPFLRELPGDCAERYAEKFDGRLERITSGPEVPRAFPATGAGGLQSSPTGTGKYLASAPAFCRHRIFGRGKIIKRIDKDKLQVEFQGYGQKVILENYLIIED